MVPSWFLDAAADPSFWRAWFFEDHLTDREPLPEALLCDFEVDNGYQLILEADPRLLHVSLSIQGPGDAEPTLIAWNDRARFHPAALRWDEVKLIGRALSTDPKLPHPGLVTLLLCRFAPICRDDDESEIVGLLEAAWRSAPQVPAHDVTRYIDRLDRRQEGFRWRQTERGFAIEQPDLESRYRIVRALRSEHSEEFPWDGFEALLAAAAGVAAGVDERIWPATRFLRPSYHFDLVTDGQSPGTWRAIDEALRYQGIGSSAPGGSTRQMVDDQWVTIESRTRIELRGDLEWGLEATRAIIDELGIPVRKLQQWHGFQLADIPF